MVYMVVGFGVLSIILVCTTAYYYAAYKDEESARFRYQELGREVARINDETLKLCEELLKELTDAQVQRNMYKKELDELKSLTRGKLWVERRFPQVDEMVLDKKITWCDDICKFGPDVLCSNETVGD